jgi:multiple sugar transport system substrate-binding protein
MEGHRKRLAVLLALAATLSAVVAGSAIARSDKAGAGTLNIYGSGPGDDVQENRAAYAASQLQGTDINRPAGDFNDQVFLTRLASGDVPDLVRMTRARVAQYAAKGVLQQMDSCVNPVKKQYRAGAMAAMTYKGHIYGVPEFTQPVIVYVNQSAFKSAGVPLSAAQTKNKKALLATAKKLTKFDNNGNPTQIGFDPKIDSGFGFYLWVKWFGKQYNVISNDGLHAKLNTPQAIQALTFAKQIIDAQGGWNKFKAFRDTWDFFGKQNPLVKNQVGFFPAESFYLNSFSNNSPDVDLVVKFFANSKGGPITMFSGNGWVVPKASKNKDAACRYMKAVTSVNAWLNAAKKREAARKAGHSTFTGLYTANTTADQKIYNDVYQSFGHPQFDKAVQTTVHSSKYGFELPASPGGQQLVQSVTDAVNRVLAGSQTPKAALNQAQREAQKAIDANK